MVTKEVAKSQIRRFGALRPIPDEFGRKEIGEVMMAAKSEAHLSAAVERILRVADFYPNPSTVREALEATPDPAEQPNGDCVICEGSGWYHVEIAGNTHGAMRLCACPAGRAKREAARK